MSRTRFPSCAMIAARFYRNRCLAFSRARTCDKNLGQRAIHISKFQVCAQRTIMPLQLGNADNGEREDHRLHCAHSHIPDVAQHWQL